MSLFVSAQLMGRLANGNEADQGKRIHLVPQAVVQYGYGVALCGAKPGRRSGGWDVEYFKNAAPTCPRCVRKQEKVSL
jgi:hypothetical protein